METKKFADMSEGEQIWFIAKKVLKRIVVAIVIILLLSTFKTVGAGERGVVLRLGAVNRVMTEGLNFKIPLIEGVEIVNVKTQTISFEAASCLGAASKDLQDVSVCVVTNYHQDYSKVGDIYKQYGSSYEENVLSPLVRETVKSIASKYTAEELVTKRSEVSDMISTKLSEQFTSKSSILEKFNIVNFSFSNSFNESIEAKVTAEQNALASKNKLEQIKYEAEQRITTATAEAEAIRIQAQAIQNQGGAEYVNLKAIEKWDGILPTTMVPGGALPFINVK